MLGERFKALWSRILWDDPLAAFAQTVTMESILWLLYETGNLNMPDSPLFWVSLGVALFVALGVIQAIRRPQSVGTGDPDIRCTIPVVQSGVRGTEAGVLLFLSVKNLGAPSVVTGWRATVKVPGGEERPLNVQHTDLMEAELPDGRAYTVGGDDLIYRKTATPIAKGGMEVGFLQCVSRKVGADNLAMPGTVITAYCEDVTGEECSCSVTIGDTQDPMPHLVGMETLQLMRALGGDRADEG